MKNHFELTEESRLYRYRSRKTVTLYRIRATRDSHHVKKGTLGGWVQSEDNLSDEAWVADEAIVAHYARVYGKALVRDRAQIRENSQVYEHAMISDDAKISGNAKIHGRAFIRSEAEVYEWAEIFDNADVSDDTSVHGTAKVRGNSKVIRTTDLYEGDWSTSPLQMEGRLYFLSMSTPTVVKLGNVTKTIAEWLSYFENPTHNESPALLKEFMAFLTLAKDRAEE